MSYPPELPQDMRDLLIRLDQRVADGFDNINKQFVETKRETDDLKNRVSALEEAQATRPLLIEQHRDLLVRVDTLEDYKTASEAKIDGAKTTVRWVWGFILALVAVIGYVGYKIEVRPDTPVATHKVTETITVPTSTNLVD